MTDRARQSRGLALAVFLLLGVGEATLAQSTNPIDFDAPVFVEGLPLFSVFRASNAPHVYFFLPTGLEMETTSSGAPAISLWHHSILRKSKVPFAAHALLTVKMQVGGSTEAAALAKLRAVDSLATVEIPLPVDGQIGVVVSPFYVNQPPKLEPTGAPRSYVLSFVLSRLGARVFLSSASEGSDIWGVNLLFRVRGVEHDASNVVQTTTRQISVAGSFRGACQQHPDLYIDVLRETTGCLALPHRSWWARLFGG